MKLRLLFWIVLGSLISGLLVWRNAKIYPFKPVAWQIVKSACEIAVLLMSALRLPVVLITWCYRSGWLSFPLTPAMPAVVYCVVLGSSFGIWRREKMFITASWLG
jgi:hypothetical protein